MGIRAKKIQQDTQGVSERAKSMGGGGEEKRLSKNLNICDAISNSYINLVTSPFWSSGWPWRDLKLG